MNENEEKTMNSETTAEQPKPTVQADPQAQYVYAQSSPQKNGLDLGKEMGNTMTGIVEVLKAPANGIPKFVGKANIVTSLIIAIVYALVRIIFGMISLATQSIDTSSSIEDLVSNYLSSGSTGNTFGTYVARFFMELLVAVLTLAVIACVVMLCAQLIGKQKITFFKGLSVASLYAIIAIPTVIVEFLLGLASAGLASVFTSLGTTIGIVFVTMALANEMKDNNKLPYAVGVTFACVTLVTWVLQLIF